MNITTAENAKFHYILNSQVYLALLDSRMNEITGSSYRRMPITFLLESLEPRSAKNYAVEFPPSSGDWGDIDNFAITLNPIAKNDVLEFGDVLFAGTFYKTVSLNEDDTVSIEESAIQVRYSE